MYTPFELVYGRKPNSFILNSNDVTGPSYDINNVKYNLKIAYDRALQCLNKTKTHNKKHYDRNVNSLSLHIGDKELLVDEIRNKRDPYYKIGYTVKEILTNNNVKIINCCFELSKPFIVVC